MPSNPIHSLIETLAQFRDAIERWHDAKTIQEAHQADKGWRETKEWFWPKFQRRLDAIRGLADPAIAWSSRNGFRGEEHVRTIEKAAALITTLKRMLANPEIYANKDDASKHWNMRTTMLWAADFALRELRRLAALTDAWHQGGADPDQDRAGQAERAGSPRDQGRTGQSQGTGKGAKPEGKLKKRGRPADSNAEEAKRISEAWKTGQFKDTNDLARELGKTQREVMLAIDRHRKRLERAEERRRTNSLDN